MITDIFDDRSEAKIHPYVNPNAAVLDACILTFSRVIEEQALRSYPCEKLGEIRDAADIRTIYRIDRKGRKIGFFKTYVGAPACVGSIETSFSQISTRRFILFGGAGCLDKATGRGDLLPLRGARRLHCGPEPRSGLRLYGEKRDPLRRGENLDDGRLLPGDPRQL